jgi:predicted Zn-dependent peptidase
MTNIQCTQINPRVTLITVVMRWLQSSALGFFIASGSRYENKNTQGLTHLSEHMLFKGTKNKSARDISRIVESLGATIDGFTAKEISGLYFHLIAERFEEIFNLLFEIMREADFNEQELKKEKNVISQEIMESYENPQEYVYSLFTQTMFSGHPLAFPIAGTTKTLETFSRDDLIRYHQFSSLNVRLCVSAAGNIHHSEIADKINKMNMRFEQIDYWKPPTPPPQQSERFIVFQQRPNLTQVHTIAGFRTIPMTDQRRYGITILNNIIGGTPSSRLYQRLREEEGLLHNFFTFIDFYSDIGLWCGYHISDIKNRERSLMIAFKEMQNIKKYGISKAEFESAVNFSKGMLALAAEDPLSRTTRNARKFLLLGRPISVDESIAATANLKLDDINSLLELANFEDYSTAIVGPITKEDLGQIGVAPQKIIEKTNQEEL